MLLKAGQVGNAILLMVLYRSYVAIDYNPTVCPDKSQWSLRAESLCNTSNPAYFCLLDENEKTYREFCEMEPYAQTPGHKFVIRGGLDSTLCMKSRYQPFKLTTNGYSRCMFEKTKCIEEGQIQYDNGTAISNRLCRCDYSNSYNFTKTTRRSCYCDPTVDDCSCHKIMCPAGYVLSPDYVCIELRSFIGNSHCPEIKRYQKHSERQDKDINIVVTKRVEHFATTRQISGARIAYSVLCSLFLIVGVITCVKINKADCQTTETKMEKQDAGENETHHKMLREMLMRRYDKRNVDDPMFVSTRAAIEVLDTFNNESYVTIVGSLGTGKSFLLKHVSLKMMEQGYSIIPCKSIGDIITGYLFKKKTVLVFDDVCGKYSINQRMFEEWKYASEDLLNKIKKKHIKVLFTCRLDIFNEKRFRSLYIGKVKIINLNSQEFRLNDTEKLAFIEKYNITNPCNFTEYNCFPLLCSKYNITKNVSVSEVWTYDLMQIYNDSAAGKMKYCSLVLCVLQNNKLTDSFFNSTRDTRIQAMKDDLLYECDLDKGTSLEQLKESLETLVGSYVVKEDQTYKIMHYMLDSLVKYVGENMDKLVKRYSQIITFRNGSNKK